MDEVYSDQCYICWMHYYSKLQVEGSDQMDQVQWCSSWWSRRRRSSRLLLVQQFRSDWVAPEVAADATSQTGINQARILIKKELMMPNKDTRKQKDSNKTKNVICVARSEVVYRDADCLLSWKDIVLSCDIRARTRDKVWVNCEAKREHAMLWGLGEFLMGESHMCRVIHHVGRRTSYMR